MMIFLRGKFGDDFYKCLGNKHISKHHKQLSKHNCIGKWFTIVEKSFGDSKKHNEA